MRSGDLFPFPEIQDALSRSALSKLPENLRGQLLVEAVRAEVPKGHMFDGPPLSLVVSGLIRVALRGPDGRCLTVTYLHQGDLPGLARVTGRRYPLSFEAVTDCKLLLLAEPAFEELLRRHPEVGVAVAEQLNRHIDDILHETALAAFGHVRKRILRHLLALAVSDPGRPARCQITHQEIADAVGSARETVTRVIADLKAEGLLEGDQGKLALPDPRRLRRELAS